jgi:hypothetical protein
MIKKHLVLTGIAISITLLIIATMNYPGGTYQDISTIGFSWSQNFISNLFKENALNGSVNEGRTWAIVSILFYSFSCAIFFYNFSKKIINKIASNFIRYIGILTMPFTFFISTSYHDLMLAISNILFWACIICITVYLLKSKLTFLKIYTIICLLIYYYAMYLYISKDWNSLAVVQKWNNISAILLILGLEYFTDKKDFANSK